MISVCQSKNVKIRPNDIPRKSKNRKHAIERFSMFWKSLPKALPTSHRCFHPTCGIHSSPGNKGLFRQHFLQRNESFWQHILGKKELFCLATFTFWISFCCKNLWPGTDFNLNLVSFFKSEHLWTGWYLLNLEMEQLMGNALHPSFLLGNF